jgi:hypothetical protein
LQFKFKLYCNRRSVGQFVLASRPFWGPWPDINILCLKITSFLHVGRLLWWEDGSVICSAITHWLESRRTHNHILLSHLRLPQPGGPGPFTHIPLEYGGSVIPPGTEFPFRHLLRLAGYGGGPTDNVLQSSRPEFRYDWRSFSQYVLVPSPLWACDQTLSTVWRFLSESCFLVSVGRPLWREFEFEYSYSSCIATDCLSACLSWCLAPCGAHDQMLIFFVWQLLSFFLHVGRPLCQKNGSLIWSGMTHYLESRKTHNHILLSHLRVPQPGGPGAHTHNRMVRPKVKVTLL